MIRSRDRLSNGDRLTTWIQRSKVDYMKQLSLLDAEAQAIAQLKAKNPKED